VNVLYTAIFGQSDALKPAPAGPDRCVCVTDDPTLTGLGWEIDRRPASTFPRWDARAVKLTPHRLFPDATIVVWADGSMQIRDWPRLLADLGDAEVAALPHPDRTSIYDEGETVIRLRIGDRGAVSRALASFRRDGFETARLSTTGLLVRRMTTRVREMNVFWLAHLTEYGINDQVHFDYCAWKAGVSRAWLAGHYRANPYMTYDRADHHRRRQPPFLLERDRGAHDLAGR
jgi:hypothetical protein